MSLFLQWSSFLNPKQREVITMAKWTSNSFPSGLSKCLYLSPTKLPNGDTQCSLCVVQINELLTLAMRRGRHLALTWLPQIFHCRLNIWRAQSWNHKTVVYLFHHQATKLIWNIFQNKSSITKCSSKCCRNRKHDTSDLKYGQIRLHECSFTCEENRSWLPDKVPVSGDRSKNIKM
jgi:hypothetical protein